MSDTKVVTNADLISEVLTISNTLITEADFTNLTKHGDNPNVTHYYVKVSGNDVYWSNGVVDPTTSSGSLWVNQNFDIISWDLFESISWIRKGTTDASILVTPLTSEQDKARVIERKPVIESDTLVADNIRLAGVDLSTTVALRAYADVYLPAPATLVITAGTPLSPTTYTFNPSVTPLNFIYDSGSLKYVGDQDVLVSVNAVFSVTSLTNNIITKFYVGKNGTPDTASEIIRKIGTGADVGAGAVTGLVELSTNDYIDFFVDSDTSATITIERSNVTVATQ